MGEKIVWWLMASFVSALVVSSLMWIVYAPVMQVRKQLKVYILGRRAKIIILIVSSLVLVISLLFILWYKIHPLLASLIAVELMILSAIGTLATWAWGKRTVWKLEIRMLNQKENMLARRIKSNEREISRLERENQTIARGKQQLKDHLNEFMGIADELCQEDPPVLTLRKRKWEEEYATMGDEQLRIKKETLESTLHMQDNTPSNKQLAMELQLYLIRIEELKRDIEKPDPIMQKNEEAIKKFKLSNLDIRRRISEITQKRAELEIRLSSKLELN